MDLTLRLASDGWWLDRTRLADRDQPLVLGRDASCGLVLSSPAISRQHARLTRLGPLLIRIEDLRSSSGTRVNGQRLTGPVDARPGDRLELAETTITLECAPAGVTDPEELDALRAIAAAPRTSTLRLVYADWLEGRGQAVRADFVRTQLAMNQLGVRDPGFTDRSRRLAELSPQVPRDWAESLAVVAVANCGREPRAVPFEFLCTQAWDSLERTGREGERRCPVCAKTVTLASDVEQLKQLAVGGHCVALRPLEAPAPQPLWVGKLVRPG